LQRDEKIDWQLLFATDSDAGMAPVLLLPERFYKASMYLFLS
jgi:hypothetical protein